MDIFERAVRQKLRFESSRGELMAEDLFDLPLTAKGSNPSLDAMTREVYLDLKDIDEVSFVDERPNPKKADLQLRFDILKFVIDDKKAKAKLAEDRAARQARKQKLLAALESRESADLAGMSKEDIKKELDALVD